MLEWLVCRFDILFSKEESTSILPYALVHGEGGVSVSIDEEIPSYFLDNDDFFYAIGERKYQFLIGLDSDMVRVEVLGQFPQQEINSFIPLYRIEEALKREPIKDLYAPLIMGCDIAGEGGDNTVVVLRRGNIIEQLFDWSGVPVNVSSRIQEDLILKHNPDAIVIDANGIGVQTYYYLEDLGGRKRSKPSG